MHPKQLDRTAAPVHVIAPMPGADCVSFLPRAFSLLVPLLGLFGCSASQPPPPPQDPIPAVTVPLTPPPPPAPAVKPAPIFPVMLGIDVLEADGFAAVKGKR